MKQNYLLRKAEAFHLSFFSIILLISFASCSNLRTIKSLDRLRFTDSDLHGNCSTLRYDGVYCRVINDSITPLSNYFFKPDGRLYSDAGGWYEGIYRQCGDTIYADLYEENGGLGVVKWLLWRAKFWAKDSVTLKYTIEMDPVILKDFYSKGYDGTADIIPPVVFTLHFVKTPLMPRTRFYPNMMERSWMWESKAWKREQKRRKRSAGR